MPKDLGWAGVLFVPKDRQPMLIPNALKKSRERYLPIFEKVCISLCIMPKIKQSSIEAVGVSLHPPSLRFSKVHSTQ